MDRSLRGGRSPASHPVFLCDEVNGMRLSLRFAVVLLLLSLPAFAQSLSPETVATASALRDGAMKGTRAFEIVRSLTLETGPRPAGSAADRAAVEWGVRTLKELGFQNVRAEKVTVPHWERGAESGEIVSPWPQPVVLAALGGSVGTPEGGIEAEVVQVPDVSALEGMDPAKVKGKIVFINKRMRRAKDGSGYGETVVGRGRGPSLAGKLGAAALLIRSVGTDNNRTPHTGATRYDEGIPKIPAAALSNPDADTLEG